MAALLAAALIFGAVGCKKDTGSGTGSAQQGRSASAEPGTVQIGVCMPDEELRWKKGAEELCEALTAQGYTVSVVYAEADPALQAQQIEAMITDQVACIVVAPVDSVELLTVEQKAKEAGIFVVAYERLLMDTGHVDGLVTFDYENIGRQMGQHIVSARKLDTALQEKQSYTIEFLMGSADDNSALLLHKGLMAVLQPYLDTGVLVCGSGRTAFADTCVFQWDPETAAEKLTNILQSTYTDRELDIVCTASDRMAQSCIELFSALEQEKWPLITGQEGTLLAAERVAAGTQSMTVYKDYKELAAQCAQVVQCLLTGQQPAFNDTERFHNHVITVPAYVCQTQMVDAKNYYEVLVQTGIYLADQLPAPKTEEK